jgi:hypothetical protein
VAGRLTEPALLAILPPPGRLTLGLAVCEALDGRDGALGEIARVLEPGGRLCAAMTQPVSLEALSLGLEAAGFVIEALRETPERLVLRARRDA